MSRRRVTRATHYRPGQKIGGRYLVHEAIRGGMGEVYLCLDLEHDAPLALKTFQSASLRGPDSGRAFAMFRDEVATWIALEDHPNIVRCFVMEIIEEQPFMLLEWIANEERRGTALRSWLRHGPLDLRLALDFAVHICRGLIHANQKQPGIVHRDLKPDNVLIGQGRLAKITDFGLAKVAQHSRAEVGEVAGQADPTRLSNLGGTPLYMAPEQWLGQELDARTDIYALGCTLYEMLAGRSPYQSPSMAGLQRLHMEVPSPRLTRSDGAHARLNALLSRCLAKNKGARFATVEEMLEALSEIYREEFGSLPVLLAEPQAPHALDLNNRAATFLRLERYERALEYAGRSLELDDRYALAHYNRGLALHHLGRHEESLPHYDRALELDPDAITYYNRGLAYAMLRRNDAAEADYRKAISLDPNHPPSHYNLAGLLLLSGRLEEALRECDLAVALDPEDAPAYHNRGGVHNAMGRSDEALADYDKAIELNPLHLSSYIMRGVVHDSRGEVNEAIADFKRAAELGDEGAARIASNLASRSDHERALKSFQEADSPEEMRLHVARVLAIADPQFLSMLEQSFLKTLESFPPDSWFDLTLAFEIKLSWLRHFADEPEVQAEGALRTEEDFLNGSLQAFMNAYTPEEVAEAVVRFPYLMAPFMAESLESLAETFPPGDRPRFKQKLSWLRESVEAKARQWRQGTAREPAGGGPPSRADEMEQAAGELAFANSYADVQEIVARHPFLATQEFIKSFELGLMAISPAARPVLEQRLNWIRRAGAEAAKPSE